MDRQETDFLNKHVNLVSGFLIFPVCSRVCFSHLVVETLQQDAVDLLLLFGLQFLDEEEDLPPLGPAQRQRLPLQTL